MQKLVTTRLCRNKVFIQPQSISLNDTYSFPKGKTIISQWPNLVLNKMTQVNTISVRAAQQRVLCDPTRWERNIPSVVLGPKLYDLNFVMRKRHWPLLFQNVNGIKHQESHKNRSQGNETKQTWQINATHDPEFSSAIKNVTGIMKKIWKRSEIRWQRTRSTLISYR